MNMEIHVEVAFSFKRDLPENLSPLCVPEGSSVLEALRTMSEAAPSVSARIFDEQGAVRRHINVLINGGNIILRQGLHTKLKDGDRLTVLPPVGGG